MTSYSNVFGGPNVQPSTVSYAQYGTIAVPLSANLQLTWATSYVDNDNPVAQVMDLNPTLGGLVVTLPDATQVSVGQTTQINNISAFSISINDFAGGLIVTIAAGLTYSVYLRDNSTDAGTWGFFQNGAIAAAAQAGPLAGYGLINLNNQLNINFPGKTLSVDYQVLDSDRGSLIVWTGGAGTITLLNPQLDGFDVSFNNDGTGILTVQTGDGTLIDAPVRGAGNTSLNLNPGESSSFIGVDGNWNSLGYGKDTFFSVNATSIDIGTPNVASITLTNQQAANLVITFTGALLQNVTVNFPATAGQWYLNNNTTNAFTVTVKLTGIGAGVVLPQGEKLIIYSDGSEMYNTPTVSTSTVFADGNAGAPGIAFTSQSSTGFYRASSGLVGYSSAGTVGLFLGGATPGYALGILGALASRYYNAANSQYVGFKAGVLAGNTIWTLPLADATSAGQLWRSDAAGNLSFTTAVYPNTTTVNQILYSSAGDTITGLATANNGVLITSAGGVPSISSTIPAATQLNITQLGTIVTGVWNGTTIAVTRGGTGLTTLTTAYGVVCAGTTATGVLQNAGTGTTGQFLKSNGAAALPTWASPGTFQVQSTAVTLASTVAVTANTWADVTGLSVAITPSLNTNRVYVSFSLSAQSNVATTAVLNFRLMRGATPIGVSTNPLGSQLAASGGIYSQSSDSVMTGSFSFVDSPATTGATTYKVQVTSSVTANIFLNRGSNDTNNASTARYASTITAMEIT